MAISGGPRRLAGLQRTPAAYANEAALAISGRAGEEGAAAPRDRGARCPAPPHIAGSGAALLGRPRCGSGGARVRRGPRWPSLRRAQAANFGGVRAAPSPPARRARPFIECLRRRPRPPRRRRAAPPGASGRGQGSDPAPLSRPGRSGAAPPAPGARGRPAAFAAPPRLSAPLSAAGPLGLRCPPLSGPSRPAPRPFRGLPPAAGRARRLAAGAERSAHAGVAGLRQDQLSVALYGVKRQHRWPPGASPSRSLGEAGGERPTRGAPQAASSWQGCWWGSAWGRNPRLLHRTRPGVARGARRAPFHSRIFPLASQPAFSRPPLIVRRHRFPRRLTPAEQVQSQLDSQPLARRHQLLTGCGRGEDLLSPSNEGKCATLALYL
ncbi:uncharacterized protein LOC115834735 isoform X2 [Nomascus leucogenys]|uniref:uncharacterized protein LOC115834735 isoform X2 n=1 Tax=Nomascus leucogenys TaxID=61853 RepID=UPI00122D55B2|nr:uncharacterized protein LOC115834735 isoform X2 [Nomascus leucogenys]